MNKDSYLTMVISLPSQNPQQSHKKHKWFGNIESLRFLKTLDSILSLIKKTALLGYNLCMTIHPFKVGNSMVFSKFRVVPPSPQFYNIFITSQRNPVLISNHSSFPFILSVRDNYECTFSLYELSYFGSFM